MTAPIFPKPETSAGRGADPFADAGLSGHPACRLAAWNAEGPPDPSFDLSLAERQRLASLKSVPQRRELEASFVLRRLLIADITGVAPEEIRLGKQDRGAPLLVQPEGWTVSLATKGALTAAALATWPGVIGVDLEPVREISWRPMLAMICNEAEQRVLRDTIAPDETALRRFFRMWTLKEAALKSTQQGFRAGPKAVETPLSIIENSGRGTLTAFGSAYDFWTAEAGDVIVSLVQLRA